MSSFKNSTVLKKIKICKNGKRPVEKWSSPDNHYDKVDTKKYNVAYLTGEINNLLVVDIDSKNGGIEAFGDYVAKHGIPDTIWCKTPNDGAHFYFSYYSTNADDNYLIENYLYTRTNLRNVGIDIRSNGGYVVAPPSSIDDKRYAWVEGQTNINEIPSSLIMWLIEGLNKKGCKAKSKEIDYVYNVDDETIKLMLSKLDDKYKNNYSDWLKITTVLKSLDKFDIWDEWCKSGKNYNYKKNIQTWNANTGSIDINYLAYLVKMPYFSKYKEYKPITIQTPEMEEYNTRYVSDFYDYKKFNEYNTAIIQSCTGSGKTTAVASHMKEYMKANEQAKILSITTRTTLSDQHVETFKDIQMKNYQKTTTSDIYEAQAVSICINSLMRLSQLSQYEMKNYVVYIDEISSFLELTHNETLDRTLKETYIFLKKLIKHAHKVIVSDALISDAVFEFLNNRTEEDKIFLVNKFKKYQRVKGIRVRDENMFLNMLIEKCKSNKPFLFGCDSCEIVTNFYNKCKDAVPESMHDKFVLITADTDFEIYDASEQFKDKFVFYSPKITFGIDFSIDTPQDVFIYNKGNSIQPSGVFQQTTRCRNINNLYYYSECKEQVAVYASIEELKTNLKDNVNHFNALYKMCVSIDLVDDSEVQVQENSFFNLYAYNEYVKDIYNTNRTKHFELLLLQNGFDLTEIGEKTKIDKDMKEELKCLTQEIKDELYEEFLDAEDKTLGKYQLFNKNIEFLQLPKNDKEVLVKFQDEVKDKYVLQEHLNVIRLMKTDDYVHNKLVMIKNESFDVKTMKCVYNKIKTIRDIEERYDMKPLDPNIDTSKEFIKLDDNTYNYIKKLFRTTKKNPENYKDLIKLYVSMIKNIVSADLFTSERSKRKEDRDKVNYSLNKDLINYHLELNKYYNSNCRDFHNHFVEKFNIEEKSLFNNEDIDTKLLDI